MNITVSAYNRPDYLEQTLAALRSCDGIADCEVIVLIDLSEVSDRCVELARKHRFSYGTYSERLGCNQAIQHALAYGFNHMQSEFHVHLEDDTVPTRDFLRWMAWARDQYRDDPGVMSVSGYQQVSNGCLDECGLRRWFSSWGWGVWRDRWLGLHMGWTQDDLPSWDLIVNRFLRAGRYEAFPTVSRIQNIGAEKGTHVPSAQWHAKHQHVPVTADDIACQQVDGFREVLKSDHADHKDA